MKIQNLAIIFLVITIPLIMVLSYYLKLQQDTLKLQAEYDTKLAEATKEGIKAFEVNTVDWQNQKSNYYNSRKNAKAIINTFTTSLANNLNISGTAKEYMLNYIPAMAITMYDGYYVYAPAYVPVTAEDDNGVQLYGKDEKIVDSDMEGAEILYVAEAGKGSLYDYTDEDGYPQNYKEKLTTKIEEAKKEYKHNLSNKVGYSTKYKGTNTDVVVNYTLDNRVYVYGKVNGEEDVERDGYLVYFKNDSVMPRAHLKASAEGKNAKEADIEIDKKITETEFVNDNLKANTKIEPETLQEQILYKEGSEYKLGTFKYVYTIEHEKVYYDEAEGEFFRLKDDRERLYLSTEAKFEEYEFKSVSILWGKNDNTTEYKKIYQCLNGGEDKQGKWYISLKNTSADREKDEIDTEITNLSKLGLESIEIYQDCSDISYYVEAYAFTNWVNDNLGKGKLTQIHVKYNKEKKEYESKEDKLEQNVFNIYENNDPEDEFSPICEHKREVMKENITANLNLAITNYNRRGTYDFKLPILSENDWDQLFSNISLLTFFQGVPIGLKYYNNYAISTSTSNREYVDPNEIYFSGKTDKSYHRALCNECSKTGDEYTGYRSVEYILKQYAVDKDNTMYYYQHDNQGDTSSQTGCYYCAVNKANYKKNEADSGLRKSYNEAIARERYYQYKKVKREQMDILVEINKKVISNTDIVLLIDESSSMDKDNLKNVLNSVLSNIGLRNASITAVAFSGPESSGGNHNVQEGWVYPNKDDNGNNIGEPYWGNIGYGASETYPGARVVGSWDGNSKYEESSLYKNINLRQGNYSNFRLGMEQVRPTFKELSKKNPNNKQCLIIFTDGLFSTHLGLWTPWAGDTMVPGFNYYRAVKNEDFQSTDRTKSVLEDYPIPEDTYVIKFKIGSELEQMKKWHDYITGDNLLSYSGGYQDGIEEAIKRMYLAMCNIYTILGEQWKEFSYIVEYEKDNQNNYKPKSDNIEEFFNQILNKESNEKVIAEVDDGVVFLDSLPTAVCIYKKDDETLKKRYSIKDGGPFNNSNAFKMVSGGYEIVLEEFFAGEDIDWKDDKVVIEY